MMKVYYDSYKDYPVTTKMI
uniref:Uncharacterized protein n=1 Tax=Arundo donax TaxID=35708 RepID=A0A0A8ZE84_ARUDO